MPLKPLKQINNDELYNRYTGYINQAKLIKGKTINQIVKEFLNGELQWRNSTEDDQQIYES